MKPPIADPSGALQGEVSEQRFYMRTLRLCVSYFWCTAILTAPLFWFIISSFLRSHSGHSHTGLPLFVYPVGVCVVIFLIIFLPSCLLAWLLTIATPMKVSDSYLKGPSALGAQREVRWSEIHSVRFFWMLLPYAGISTAQKKNVIWLPLTLRDMAGFKHCVEKNTAPENPLRLFLEKRGY